jgi:signal transduction histidine kinase
VLAGLRRRSVQLPIEDIQRGLLLGSIGLTLIFVLTNFVLSWPYLDQPFSGFLQQNGVVTESRLAGWPARRTVLERGDVILTVDGQTFHPAEWPDFIRQQPVNLEVTYTVLNADNQFVRVTLPISIFTARDFIQLVTTPIFVALIALITAGVAVYFRSQLSTVKLFALFTLAMVYSLASLPDFVIGWLYPFNFISAAAGEILMPPLLLHFLFLFPSPRKILQNWPFIIPLLYLPVLPALIYLSTLLEHSETSRYFERIIFIYAAIYMAIGLLLLIEATIWAENESGNKQALLLLVGFTLPTGLFILNALPVQPITQISISQVLGRYAFIGIPLAIAFAMIRYDMFDIDRTSRWHVSYLETIAILMVGYVVFILVINPIRPDLGWLTRQDMIILIATGLGFLILRPAYKNIRHWFEVQFRGSVEDFRIGLRILSQELLKVRSRRDLEVLVSWDIPTDFRLKSAELAPGDKPNSPYAVRLPLRVSNISLGTLFLGGKIDGTNFSTQELALLTEVQRQVSLALWSLELDNAIHATEELTRLKSKFLANVTHELRTPLNGIINYIGFVLDGDVGPLNREQTNHLNQALQNTEKLLEIINNILDMSKIEAGQMTFNIRPVDLAEVVSNLVPVVEEIIGSKPVTLVTEVSPIMPTVYGDPLRLRQIILNLLSNAAKFTSVGMIRLNIYPENSNVAIQISDTGPGIDETVLPTIFQQFITTNLVDIGPHTDGGPGLGLPITKYLVDLQRGQIKVESYPGRGATFTVCLPLDQRNRTKIQQAAIH